MNPVRAVDETGQYDYYVAEDDGYGYGYYYDPDTLVYYWRDDDYEPKEADDES